MPVPLRPRWLVLLAAAFSLLIGVAATASAAAPSLAGVEAALKKSPVYIDPAAAGPGVDASRLLPVVPKNTYFAELPTADVAATAVNNAPADPAALPALLSAQIGQGGTFVVLVGGKLYGASTTIPGSLADQLGSAQSAIMAGGDATGALVALMRSLSGSGGLSDAASPSHAGGPVGPALLIALAIALAVGALALWWWLRRPAKPRRKPRSAPRPRDLVEIDHEGNVVRFTPASERER